MESEKKMSRLQPLNYIRLALALEANSASLKAILTDMIDLTEDWPGFMSSEHEQMLYSAYYLVYKAIPVSSRRYYYAATIVATLCLNESYTANIHHYCDTHMSLASREDYRKAIFSYCIENAELSRLFFEIATDHEGIVSATRARLFPPHIPPSSSCKRVSSSVAPKAPKKMKLSD